MLEGGAHAVAFFGALKRNSSACGPQARQRLVDGMKDALLEFLLQYLPSMPIPPIDGEEDGLEYSVSGLR